MKKRFFLILAATISFAATAVIAQGSAQKYACVMHPEIMMDQPGKCPKCGMTLVAVRAEKKRPTFNVQRPASNEEGNHASHDRHPTHDMPHMSMQSSVNVAEPMSRESSGSSWVPDSTPMYGRMFMFGDDMLMLHGGIFPRYVNANTRRGDDRIDGPNWFMAMYSHPLGESAQIGFRGMMSLDLITERGSGNPL
ncbi:MAG: hypothetical protein QOC70_95 [Verrucomicrobiota bacterium]